MVKKRSPKSSSSPPGTKGGAGEKCVACGGKGISSSDSRCHPCGGTGKRKPAPSFSGEKKEERDMSRCWSCTAKSLYNLRTKKFVGYCADCKDVPF